MPNKQLLSVIEVGGYPDFSPLYQNMGFNVSIETTMRKTLKYLKKNQPDLIIAEFNFQSDFRDRTSSLESMMSLVQRMETTKVIIFYDKEFAAQLDRLKVRFDFDATITFPVDESILENTIKQLFA